VAGAVVVAAFYYDGEPVADIELHDGGVWVTNSDELMVGRVNYPVQELDGSVTTASDEVDVLQDGSTVFVVDSGAALLQTLDPATVSTGTGAVTIPRGAELQLGGGTIGMLDPSTGALRSVPVEGANYLGDPEAEPAAHLGEDGQLAVGPDGRTHGLSIDDASVVTVEPGGTDDRSDAPGAPQGVESASESASESPTSEPVAEEGDQDEEETSERVRTRALATTPDALDLAEQVALTSVGDRAVVAVVTEDDDELLVYVDDQEPIDLTAYDLDLAEVAVQQPGARSDEVVLATRDALVHVPLGGGEPSIIRSPREGGPARPIVVGDCVHGAWDGSDEGSYLLQCGNGEPADAPIPLRGGDHALRLRENHGLVVVNDTLTGTVYLPQEDMQLVDNWDDTTPPDGESEDETDSPDDRLEDVPPDREEENRPPTANPDSVGVRAGSTTVVEVLANDSDPDGDLLTVTDIEDAGEQLGDISVIEGGRAVQITVPAEATGRITVPYSITDGRENGEASSTLTVEVVPDDVNSAPEFREGREPRMDLALGGTATIDVLSSMVDPEGDAMVLQSAETDSDDVVHFTPDGTLTFVDTGTESGLKEVTVRVSDGSDTTEVTVPVEVRESTNLPPRAVGDFIAVTEGEEVLLDVLANDVDPEGEPLRLGSVTTADIVEVTPDYDTGQIHLEGLTEGTAYLEYVVADAGGADATGLVRVDVVAPDPDGAPIAVRDTALLPAGGTTLVDVLANDDDPAGGLLAVQQIDVPPDSPLVVSVIDHRLLRISAQTTPTGPQTLTYTVSNGSRSAVGEVTVLPILADSAPQPPVAEPDVVDVRAGDYVTIPVLQNDSHPQGMEFSLDPELQEVPDADRGHFFTSGDVVRFRAPDTPQTVNAVYSITDENGNSASALVTVRVQASSESNAAPIPEPIEVRAFGGERIRIQVPVYGIDPDGDSVQLLGADTAPSLGRIVEIGPGYLDYEAYGQSSGTDTFSYAVRDRLGAIGSAQIRVAVVPPPISNSRPQAQADSLEVRPGRTVDVDVLRNDTDADGDPLYLADAPDGGPFDPMPELAPEATEQHLIRITAPLTEGRYPLTYRASDRRGGIDSAVATVTVSEDAPLLPPIARDDLVAPADIIGHDVVTIPVLANDEDPDGTADALTVELIDVPEGALVTGNNIQVPVLPERQVLTYRVEDPDGLEGFAFIDIPGSESTAPVLRTNVRPIEVHSGELVEISIYDYVVAPSGRPIRLTDTTQVTATNSDGGTPVVDATTLQFRSAEDYYGPASITFEVTDGITARGSLSSRLTLPITVLSDGVNLPPTFRGGEMDVVPGEGEVALNLRSSIDDPEDFSELRLDFGEDGLPEGLEGRIEGHTLYVAADVDLAPGQTLDVPMTVSDPENDPVPSVIEVHVRPTDRDLPSVPDLDIGEVEQGQTVAVDVLAGAFNPFEAEGEPLTIIGAQTERGTATVDHSLSDVSITPGADHVGPVTVRVTVEDGTGLPTRRAEARITMNVIGAPGRPTPPRVVDEQDSAVVLTWPAPVSNGSPITGYTVDTAGHRQVCATTTCTITGLTNAQEYTFTVIATNAVGDSDPSAPSGPAMPDVRPERPNAPEAERGDGSASLRWEVPATRGTPVERYDVQVSPASGSGQISETSTAYTWDGLTNGTSYTFRVRAYNQADEPSEWSPWSAPVVPAGPPTAPGEPQVQRVDSPIEAQISGSFGEAQGNGAPVTGYEVIIYQDGNEFSRFETTGTSFTQDAPEGHEYTVAVVAINEVGTGPASPRSNSVRSYIQPTAPGRPTATATGTSREITLDYSAANPRGDEIVRYEVSTNGGAWEELHGDRITGLDNGSSYQFRVRACNQYCGDPSPASATQIPYGPMGEPELRTVYNEPTHWGDPAQIEYSWDVPNGNGRPIISATVTTGLGTRRDGLAANGYIENVPWDRTYQATITVVRDLGNGQTDSVTTTASQRVPVQPDRPERNVEIRFVRDGRDEPRQDCDDDNDQCRFLDFTWTNFGDYWAQEGPYEVRWINVDNDNELINSRPFWRNPDMFDFPQEDGQYQSSRAVGADITVRLEIRNRDGDVVASDTYDINP
jgi:hypothetical protein